MKITWCVILVSFAIHHPKFWTFQRQVLQVETDKEKVETQILKQQEQMEMLQVQLNNAGNDKDNLQQEMEILLDRINKLSEMVDKSRVWIITM